MTSIGSVEGRLNGAEVPKTCWYQSLLIRLILLKFSKNWLISVRSYLGKMPVKIDWSSTYHVLETLKNKWAIWKKQRRPKKKTMTKKVRFYDVLCTSFRGIDVLTSLGRVVDWKKFLGKPSWRDTITKT